ncbi:MAG: hypothetical protein QM783_17380 [Phycisphaerales bacterium]
MAAVIALAVGAPAALGQPVYTFELRLIPDGITDAPTGPGTTYNIGDPSNSNATRVGFWLQARVSASSGENWGIMRASSPPFSLAPASSITVSDPAAASGLSRGTTNAANTNYGRYSVYRVGGVQTGNANNPPGGSIPYPGSGNTENGVLDQAGPAGFTRVYGFDCFIDIRRNPTDLDNPTNPWGVNGALTGPSVGHPVPPGEFAPWANLYRVWVDIGNTTTPRTVTLNASAWLNAGVRIREAGFWEMFYSEGQLLSAEYSFTIAPTPGAAVLLALTLPLAGRRRRAV